MPPTLRPALVAGTLAVLIASPGLAQEAKDSDAELAKKLNNPVSSLISVPLQFNYDCCYGPSEGERYTLNIQPVMPFKLSEDWNVIVRTIVPVVYQGRTTPQSGDASGLGDVTQSFFFSPKPSASGRTWAVGPAFLWPLGESELGSKKWGAGPTLLVLEQKSGWTYGLLANHIWSYADLGDHHRSDVSSTFVQPFLSWTNAQHTTVGLNAESTYNWKTKAWTIPVNMTVNHLYRFGDQRMQLSGGIRFYAAREDFGPDWGLRFTTTFLFPR